MCNILYEELPDYVTLFEEKYPVHTSFKNWIEIMILAENGGLDDAKSVAKMLKLCYKEKLPPNIVSAVLGMMVFLKGDTDFSVPSEKSTDKVFSFDADYGAIYSTFYAKYGIDLINCDMHWYKFRALFEGLASENPFSTLIKIRTTDETEIKDKKAQRHIKKLKAKYSIKPKTEIDVAENISSLF
jgi:hypothetical protein